jgi:hypothetical protein
MAFNDFPMRTGRTLVAADPRLFGRAACAQVAQEARAWNAGDDLKLFATTFAAGFLFLSILIF